MNSQLEFFDHDFLRDILDIKENIVNILTYSLIDQYISFLIFTTFHIEILLSVSHKIVE